MKRSVMIMGLFGISSLFAAALLHANTCAGNNFVKMQAAAVHYDYADAVVIPSVYEVE